MPQKRRPHGAGGYRELSPGAREVRASLGRRADGKRRAVSRTVHGTEADASVAAVRIMAERGSCPSVGESVTLEQYCRGVFRLAPSNRGTTRSAATLAQHDSQMERNVLPFIGDAPLSAITRGRVKAVVLASSAPALTKRTLRAVMRAAYDDGLIDEKPLERRIVTPQARRPQRAPWTAREAPAALAAMRGRPLGAYLVLGLSGLREEEALGISPADIVPQATFDIVTGTEVRTLTLVARRRRTGADGLVDGAKNDASVRERPAIVAGRERLLEIVAATRPDPSGPAAAAAWRESRLVTMRDDALYGPWRSELEALGLRFIPPDMLRHTSETLMRAAGLPDTVASRFHGHAVPKTGYANYMRPGAATMEDAARKVHKLMSGGDSQRDVAGWPLFMQKARHMVWPAVFPVGPPGFEPRTRGLSLPR